MRNTPRTHAAKVKSASKRSPKKSGHAKHHIGKHQTNLNSVVKENQERLDVIEQTIGEDTLRENAEPGKGGY